MSKNFISRWLDKLLGREKQKKELPDNAIPKPKGEHVRGITTATTTETETSGTSTSKTDAKTETEESNP